MRTRASLGFFVLVSLIAASRSAHAQYVYYYSSAASYGGYVYGTAVVGAGAMGGEYHSFEQQVTVRAPSGRTETVYGWSTRVDCALYNGPPYAEYGTFLVTGRHSVYCTAMGWLLYWAPSFANVVVGGGTPALQQFNITARAFIPPPSVLGTWFCVGSFGMQQIIGKGDNRGFHPTSGTSKMDSRVKIEPNSSAPLVSVAHDAGVATHYAYSMIDDGIPNDCWLFHQTAPAAKDEMYANSFTLGSGAANVKIWGKVKNPLVGSAPPIDWDLSVDVNNSNPAASTYTRRSGLHDCFPAYEMYVQKATGSHQRIYEYIPASYDPFYIGYCLMGVYPQVSVWQSGPHPINP